jgi:pimeloyl-ACP methyl ester carboxylesterase
MGPFSFPSEFRTRNIATNGTSIHVRSGGTGPAAVLLHGYGETGDMWAPMAADLVRDHTVVVPDLRGMGLSSKPAGGFDKKTQAGDVAGVLDELKIDRADLVTHDIGNMVGYAFAAQNPDRVGRFVLIDAPLPGIGPWEEILKNPLLWHFRFGGPDMERLVEGRERIYLDRFWNEFSANPSRFSEDRPRALFGALRNARRNAFRFHAVCSVRPRCYRQPAIPGKGQARYAGAGSRRRKIIWHDDGKDHAVCSQQRA